MCVTQRPSTREYVKKKKKWEKNIFFFSLAFSLIFSRFRQAKIKLRHDVWCNAIGIDFIICLFSATHSQQTDNFMWSDVFFSSFFCFESFCSRPQYRCISNDEKQRGRAPITWCKNWSLRIHTRCSNVTKKLTKRKVKRKNENSIRMSQSPEVGEIVVCGNEK